MNARQNNEQDYVPLNNSDLVAETFRTITYTEKYTEQDFQRDQVIIDNIIDTLGGPVPLTKNDFRYVDELYSSYAINILSLSRTKYWPKDIKIDNYLEAVLVKWLGNRITNSEESISKIS